MSAYLENSTVATGLEKVSFHANPKERQAMILKKCLLQVVLMVKNLPAIAGGIRDSDFILRLGRSPGGENDTLQYSCLENPMD